MLSDKMIQNCKETFTEYELWVDDLAKRNDVHHNNFAHIASNLAQVVLNVPSYPYLASDNEVGRTIEALKLYRTLLETFPEYRQAELNPELPEGGFFPSIRSTGGYGEKHYVFESAKKLGFKNK